MANRRSKKKKGPGRDQAQAGPPASGGTPQTSPAERDRDTGGATPSATRQRSQAQNRALHAFQRIEDLPEERGNYLSYVKALPATIIMSGLGQAMAMEKAGVKDRGHCLLYKHVESWLCNIDGSGWSSSPYEGDDLLRGIVNGSHENYVRAQAEALEYLDWLKKFAVANLSPISASENEDQDASA